VEDIEKWNVEAETKTAGRWGRGTAGVHAKETGGATDVKSGSQKRQGIVSIPFGATTGESLTRPLTTMTHRSLAILPFPPLLGYCGRVVMASRLGLWLIRDGKPREFESRQCQSFFVASCRGF
jgi:hypothetical protein